MTVSVINSFSKYPSANEMDPAWVCHRLMPDLGLPQYSTEFEIQLCDGLILNTLTRRDLEKHFHIHRKFHQTSLLHAIELLRMVDFNKEVLSFVLFQNMLNFDVLIKALMNYHIIDP